jgi:phage protein U
MFAQLGNIKFNLITYFNGLEMGNKYDYAEHQVIEGKAKLQYSGEALESNQIRLNFHSSFCDPREELKKLKELAKKHQALDFMFGNGEQKGKHVIEEINGVTSQTDKLGNIVAIEVYVRLKEHNEDKKPEARKAQRKVQAKTRAKAKRKSIPKKKKKVVKLPKNIKTQVKSNLSSTEKQVISGIVRQDWLHSSLKTDYAKTYGTIKAAN